MTLNELSIKFDIMYNNISSTQAPGLTEYEKSVFLTQAQEAIILELYKGVTGDSFETTEEVTRYLNFLVKTKTANLPKSTNYFINNILEYKLSTSEIEDLWFVTYQSGTIDYNNLSRDVLVVPAKQDSLFKELNNPFKGPNQNKVLSLSEDNNITLYSKYPMNTYYIKYIKRPSPINLEEEDVLELPECLHNQVLIRAVQLAKAVWQS